MKNPANYRDWLAQLRRREDLLRILMFTVFTVFCWVGFSIFLSQQKTKIPAETVALARPLTPAIDVDLLDQINQRVQFTEAELESFPIYAKEVDADGNTVLRVIGSEGSFVIDPNATVSATPNPAESVEENQPIATQSALPVSPSPVATTSAEGVELL